MRPKVKVEELDDCIRNLALEDRILHRSAPRDDAFIANRPDLLNHDDAMLDDAGEFWQRHLEGYLGTSRDVIASTVARFDEVLKASFETTKAGRRFPCSCPRGVP